MTKSGDSEPTALMQVMLMSSGASGTTIHPAETRLLEVPTSTALLSLEAKRKSLALFKWINQLPVHRRFKSISLPMQDFGQKNVITYDTELLTFPYIN